MPQENYRTLPNGANVIAIDFAVCIVLASQQKAHGTEYITWTFNNKQGLGSTCWGHYFTDELKARADFNDRCKRGY